jgi:hypothetical protein
MMARHLYTILSFLFMLIVSGCGKPLPEEVGMSQSDWDNLSSSQRATLMMNYDDIQRTRQSYLPKMLHVDRAVSIKISGGTVHMPPNFEPVAYDPIWVVVAQDHCKRVMVAAKDKHQHTDLSVCFWGHELWLDPSNKDPQYANFSVRMFESSLWRKFIYNDIHSDGYVGFDHATVALKLMEHRG